MSVPDDEAAELANDLAIANAQVKWMEAEIERLTAALREYACTATDHPCGCYNQFLSERAEIERLHAEVKAMRGLVGEIDRQHAAERDELLAALRPFVNARIVDATMRRTARAAVAKVLRGK